MFIRRRSLILAAIAGLLPVCCISQVDNRPNAVEQFAKLQEQAHAARVAGDKQARLQAVLHIVQLLNDAPDALEAVAQVYVEAGDNEHALAALREFADLGQADHSLLSGDDKKFAAIRTRPQYQAILKRFRENETAISRAETAFELGDPGLVAEDIDYDPASKTFLITSVLEKKIIRVAPDGKAKDFASSPSHWPMLAVKIDASRKLVWATEVALDDFTAAPKADWGRSALLCFDLNTGALRQRIEGPAHSALGDMLLSPEGDPIVSDGNGGGVYRLSKGLLQRIDGGDFISPQTPAMDSDGKNLFVPDYARGIGVLDLTTRRVTWLSQRGKYALNGIDGLYYANGALIATQNGTSPERVIRFRLNSGLGEIESEQIIERRTAALGDPTHGVVVGDLFYYIANSGWSGLDDHGDLKPGSKLTPARVMRFHLR
jgi:tetratricopeptide (TPR) repeat protein